MSKKKVISQEQLDTPREIEWKKEYSYTSDDFMVIPVCPTCGEPAYEKDQCVFCKQKYIYVPKPKEYEDIVVQVEDVIITQIYGSWSIYIERNGNLLSHLCCSKRFSENQLKELAKPYIKGN